MKFRMFFIILFSLITFSAQTGGFKLNGADKQKISFQLINNLILIPVTVNGVKLTFLLDSGVAETILFSLEDKEVNFSNVEKIKFAGLGENKELYGLKSSKNDLKIGEHLEDKNHSIYLILNEGFNFSSHVGIPVNGIIGYNFFVNHPVEINYQTKKITIYNNEKTINKRKRKFQKFDISLELKKPYILADVILTDDAKSSKLLIDLGNSDAIWLFPKLIENFTYNRPNIEDYLGRGFNGDIFGKRSRIHQFFLGDFKFEKPLTALPDEFSIQHLSLAKDRKGSIGNEILRRFTVIFDYPTQKVYLKKNRNFNDPFLFNMSGLDIKHDGMTWTNDLVPVETEGFTVSSEGNKVYSPSSFQYKFTLNPSYSIAACRQNSPAFLSGIRSGDIILKINNKKASTLKLQDILNLLKSEEGKKINMEVQRRFEILKFSFILEDPIPYQN